MNHKVMFSSKSLEWGTPQNFFNDLDLEFDFTLDAAACRKNAKCKNFFSKSKNALLRAWNGRVFCNPPYGRAIKDFVYKAASEIIHPWCDIVVMLLPARTDTRYFHGAIYNKPGVEIRFLKGRLKFEGGGCLNSAPFPSMVVIFRKK